MGSWGRVLLGQGPGGEQRQRLLAFRQAALAAAPWPALEELSLRSHSVGDVGAAALAAAPWPALRKLSLSYCGVTEEGAAAVRASRPGLELSLTGMW